MQSDALRGTISRLWVGGAISFKYARANGIYLPKVLFWKRLIWPNEETREKLVRDSD